MLILDEFVYSSNHIASFVKEKRKVMDTLEEYINASKKVIVMDALLDQSTIDYFKRVTDKKIYTVDNTYKPFHNREAYFYDLNTVEQFFFLNSK